MSDLVAFLEARIAEDEARAQAAIAQHAPEEWESELGSLNLWSEDIIFWAHQTPQKVLAECAAKRAIIAEHEPVDFSGLGMESPNACRLCGVQTSMSDWEWAENSFPCATLQAFAAVYKDHPDYRQEWAQ